MRRDCQTHHTTRACAEKVFENSGTILLYDRIILYYSLTYNMGVINSSWKDVLYQSFLFDNIADLTLVPVSY